MPDKFRVFISVKEGVFEIEGTESFVAGQLRDLQPLIERQAESLVDQGQTPKRPTVDTREAIRTGQQPGLDDFPNLFRTEDGRVRVLLEVPGQNMADKTVNAGLLLAYANSLIGNKTTPLKAIRDLCSSQGFLDKSNFSKILRKPKTLFTLIPETRPVDLELKLPGTKRARELAVDLNKASD